MSSSAGVNALVETLCRAGNEGSYRLITPSKRYICQTYRHVERGKGVAKQLVLVQASAIECKSSAEAERRAQRMFDGGSYAGADAFMIEVDVELGDYSDPTFIVRLGDVPPLDL